MRDINDKLLPRGQAKLVTTSIGVSGPSYVYIRVRIMQDKLNRKLTRDWTLATSGVARCECNNTGFYGRYIIVTNHEISSNPFIFFTTLVHASSGGRWHSYMARLERKTKIKADGLTTQHCRNHYSIGYKIYSSSDIAIRRMTGASGTQTTHQLGIQMPIFVVSCMCW